MTVRALSSGLKTLLPGGAVLEPGRSNETGDEHELIGRSTRAGND